MMTMFKDKIMLEGLIYRHLYLAWRLRLTELGHEWQVYKSALTGEETRQCD